MVDGGHFTSIKVMPLFGMKTRFADKSTAEHNSNGTIGRFADFTIGSTPNVNWLACCSILTASISEAQDSDDVGFQLTPNVASSLR